MPMGYRAHMKLKLVGRLVGPTGNTQPSILVRYNNDIEVDCCNVRSKVSRETLALHEHGVG